MIILENDSIISDWLESFGDISVGFTRLNIDTYELSMGLQDDICLISQRDFTKVNGAVKTKLESSLGVIIVADEVNKGDIVAKNTLSLLLMNQSQSSVFSQLESIDRLTRRNILLKSELISLNKELAGALDGVETELLRVKRAYELKAPKRLDSFKGLKIFSKYAAGDDMGGEFFDLFSVEHKVFILMSSTSSYLASSAVLNEFSDFKERQTCSGEEEIQFIERIRSEIEKINSGKKKEVHMELMTCVIDTKSMKMTGHALGNFTILNSNIAQSLTLRNDSKAKVEACGFEMQIEREQRVLFHSPGLIRSWNELSPEFMIEELVLNTKIKTLDVLDEIFFQLKKNSKNGFIGSDASAIILEVQDNVVHEV